MEAETVTSKPIEKDYPKKGVGPNFSQEFEMIRSLFPTEATHTSLDMFE